MNIFLVLLSSFFISLFQDSPQSENRSESSKDSPIPAVRPPIKESSKGKTTINQESSEDLIPPLKEKEEDEIPGPIEIMLRNTQNAPKIDGSSKDQCWEEIIASIPFFKNQTAYIASAFDEKNIYFLFSFPSKSPHNSPPLWKWDEQQECYVPTNSSEITLSFLITQDPLADIQFADVWLWHSFRSTETHSIDDSYLKTERNFNLTQSFLGDSPLFSLQDLYPDQGTHAWKSNFYAMKYAETVRRFTHHFASGSVADVKGEAIWSEGYWTIEFSRKRDTQHPDDLFIGLDSNLFIQIAISSPEMKQDWFSIPILLPGVESNAMPLPLDTAIDSSTELPSPPEVTLPKNLPQMELSHE